MLDLPDSEVRRRVLNRRLVQENLVELLLMADAARGASAARVTAVMPHYAYARSDKKDEPRISIGGRLVAG